MLGVFYGGLSPLNESFIITQNNVFLFTIERLEKDARVNPPLVFETPPGLLEKVINFKEHKFDDFKKIKVMGIADAELLMLAYTNDAVEIEDKAFNIYADNPELEEIISDVLIVTDTKIKFEPLSKVCHHNYSIVHLKGKNYKQLKLSIRNIILKDQTEDEIVFLYCGKFHELFSVLQTVELEDVSIRKQTLDEALMSMK